MKTPSFGPRCPNHGCPLDGVGFPMPKKGEGICPVSGAHFDFVIEVDEKKAKLGKDKDGNVTKVADWKVEGND